MVTFPAWSQCDECKGRVSGLWVWQPVLKLSQNYNWSVPTQSAIVESTIFSPEESFGKSKGIPFSLLSPSCHSWQNQKEFIFLQMLQKKKKLNLILTLCQFPWPPQLPSATISSPFLSCWDYITTAGITLQQHPQTREHRCSCVCGSQLMPALHHMSPVACPESTNEQCMFCILMLHFFFV